MREVNNNAEIKAVQKIAFDLYKKFAIICEENGLTHYFTGGALIGVKRHGGFIPWDDDIDIVMPRKDFDIFQKIATKYKNEGYGVCNRWTDKNWHFAFLQFLDLRSEIEIHLAEIPRRSSVWIDIYPIDGVPNTKLKRKIHLKNILFHRYLVQAAYIRTQSDSIRKRNIVERILIAICKKLPMDRIINSERVLQNMERVLRKYSMNECAYSGNLLGRYRERECVPTKYWGIPKDEKFEDDFVKVPHDGDAILRQIYGDYMRLPPKDAQVAHRVKVIKCRNV